MVVVRAGEDGAADRDILSVRPLVAGVALSDDDNDDDKDRRDSGAIGGISDQRKAKRWWQLPRVLFFFQFAMYSTLNSRFSGLFFFELGFSDAEVGTILGVSSVLSLCVAPAWSALADRWRNRKKVVIICSLGSGVAFMCYAAALYLAPPPTPAVAASSSGWATTTPAVANVSTFSPFATSFAASAASASSFSAYGRLFALVLCVRVAFALFFPPISTLVDTMCLAAFGGGADEYGLAAEKGAVGLGWWEGLYSRQPGGEWNVDSDWWTVRGNVLQAWRTVERCC